MSSTSRGMPILLKETNCTVAKSFCGFIISHKKRFIYFFAEKGKVQVFSSLQPTSERSGGGINPATSQVANWKVRANDIEIMFSSIARKIKLECLFSINRSHTMIT